MTEVKLKYRKNGEGTSLSSYYKGVRHGVNLEIALHSFLLLELVWDERSECSWVCVIS